MEAVEERHAFTEEQLLEQLNAEGENLRALRLAMDELYEYLDELDGKYTVRQRGSQTVVGG